MPPWLPEPGYGDFVGERRLTAAQVSLIAEWVKEGGPKGEPSDLPAEPHFTEGWQMGPPDLMVQMAKPYRLGASGSDIFRNFVLPVNLKETRYVRAIELRQGRTAGEAGGLTIRRALANPLAAILAHVVRKRERGQAHSCYHAENDRLHGPAAKSAGSCSRTTGWWRRPQ